MKHLILFIAILSATNLEAQELKLGLPVGHQESFKSVFSPSGKVLASWGVAPLIKVWDLSSSKVLHNLEAHTAMIKDVKFSQDGAELLSYAADNSIRLWDSKTGQLKRTFMGHKKNIIWARFMDDKKHLLSYSEDSSVIKWEISTGESVILLKSADAAFSGGDYLLSGNLDPLLTNLKTGQKKSLKGEWPQMSENGEVIYLFRERVAHIYRCSDLEELGSLPHTKVGKLSPDGKYFIRNEDDSIFLVRTADMEAEFAIPRNDRPFNIYFSPDGSYLGLINYRPSNVEIWSLTERKPVFKKQKIVVTYNEDSSATYFETRYFSISFSNDAKVCISESAPEAAVHELPSGKELGVLRGYAQPLREVKLSADQKYIYTREAESFSKWSSETGKRLKVYKSPVALRGFLLLGDSKRAVTWDVNDRVYFWDLETGETKFTFTSPVGELASVHIIAKKNNLLFAGFNGIALYKVDSQFIYKKTLQELIDSSYIDPAMVDLNYFMPVAISPDQTRLLLQITSPMSLHLFDTEKGLIIKSTDRTDYFANISFSPDSRFFASSDQFYENSEKYTRKKQIVLLNKQGLKIMELLDRDEDFLELGFSLDSKYLTVVYESYARVIDVNNAKELFRLDFRINARKVHHISASRLLVVDGDNNNETWDLKSGKRISVSKMLAETELFDESDSGLLAVQVLDGGGFRFWRNGKKKEAISIYILGEKDYIHINTYGQFDATPSAMELMYWVKGSEIIEFSQLKDRYWVPGLIEKTSKGEELPKARGMGSLKLQPEVELTQLEASKLKIILKKRDGGYGKVAVLINGKEIASDARGSSFNENAATQTITLDISGHPYLLNGENTITVKAASADEFIQGRGASTIFYVKKDTLKAPRFFALVVGVGKYSNPAINLRYSVTDALAISDALKLGAENLFGRQNVYVHTLTSDGGKRPDKHNILAVFDSIARMATASDLITVYMSGHGITWGGAQGDFYFLTADAASASADAFNDPEIRKIHSISTNEIVDALKKISALKQLMILDACGSGKAVDNLLAARSVDASQLKALDRMKDRTGMFIISGCAADALSYEASRYGQGLLTYSVLRSLKGPGLRDDKFMDVGSMLVFAGEEVPKLADDIGGIQKPQLLIPKSGSYDIGMLSEDDKKKIKISEPKPVFVRSSFMDLDELDDVLQLSKAVDDSLNSMASRGPSSSLVYFDVREYPDAIRVNGSYTRVNSIIKLKVKFKKNDQVLEKQLEASDKQTLLTMLLAEIEAFAKASK